MRATVATSVGLCLALVLGASSARAALTAGELALDEAALNQFNVITFGDLHANNETEGRVAVGGNFYGDGSSHNICFNGCSGDTIPIAGSSYGALTVWGNVSGGASSGAAGANFYIQGNNAMGSTLQMQHNGGVGIAGSNDGTITSPTFITTTAGNAGTTQNASNVSTGQPASAAFPFAPTMPFQGALTDLATSIAADAAADAGTRTVGAYVKNTQPEIAATKAAGSYGGKNYGFITISLANLETYQNFEGIVTDGLDAVFVVVTGQATGPLPNMNNNNDDTDVIWDFVDATSLTFSGAWYGQILAPNATVTNDGDLNGAVIAESIDQNAEIHEDEGSATLPIGALSGLPTTDGTPVPEPSAIALLLVGVLGTTLLRRRVARR